MSYNTEKVVKKVEEVVEDIILSVACAASVAKDCPDPLSTIYKVLNEGKRATQHGCCLPLPVILDVSVVLSLPWHLTAMPHRENAFFEPSRTYDEWLNAFRKNIRVLNYDNSNKRQYQLGNQNIDSRENCGDCLPILLYRWPASKKNDEKLTHIWSQAYDKLLTEQKDRVNEIFKLWQGPRTKDIKLWKWCPYIVQKNQSPRPAGMWSKFSKDHSISAWPERFDHGAGYIYLDTEDPNLLPDQEKRIQRLKSRRKKILSMPFVMGIDDLDPYFGKLPISALIPDDIEEIMHRIYNHEIYWLNMYPKRKITNLINVHICWLIGYNALKFDNSDIYKTNNQEEESSMKDNIPNKDSKVRFTHASVLQGFIALLLDDWRQFLRGLPIRFYLHRGYPDPAVSEVAKTGPRWKETSRYGSKLPPSDIINILFKRHTFVEVAASDASRQNDFGKIEHRAADCWIVCLLKSDIEEFKFFKHKQINQILGSDSECWTVASDFLPKQITQMIILDASTGDGEVCSVENSSDTAEQRKVFSLPNYRRDEFPKVLFEAVRYAALDLLLNELERKMF